MKAQGAVECEDAVCFSVVNHEAILPGYKNSHVVVCSDNARPYDDLI